MASRIPSADVRRRNRSGHLLCRPDRSGAPSARPRHSRARRHDLRHPPPLVTGAAFTAAAALIALATTDTHEDSNQADAAEPQGDWPLAAAALGPITKEI